ncbi:hypothetical protein FQN50_004615 [Emmonsiellopsis sp. PD_5]|nr:hypothetical protein FQN50_004615 [Emmonsiellopsis sp. PD_5]
MPILDHSAALVDNSKVNLIRIVVHNDDCEYSTRSLGHWCIYLILHGGGSVRINMQGRAEAHMGTLDWVRLTYEKPITAIGMRTYGVPLGTRVRDFAEVIYRRGRDRYMFAEGGGGCRYWVATVLKDFREAGLIPPVAEREMQEALRYQYYEPSWNVDPTPLELYPGKFV